MSVKVGRNDKCDCGSGKKYKKCCLNGNNQSYYNHSEEENHYIFECSRAYAVASIIEILDICFKNLRIPVKRKDIMSKLNLKQPVERLMNISNENEFDRRLAKVGDNILVRNLSTHMTGSYISLLKQKCNDEKLRNLNLTERSLIFFAMDTLKFRAEYATHFGLTQWAGTITNLNILLFQLINGVENNIIRNTIIKVDDKNQIIGVQLDYGLPNDSSNFITPEEYCDKYLFYSRWKGEKHIQESSKPIMTEDFIQFTEDEVYVLSKDTFIPPKSRVNEYVSTLNSGIDYKRRGDYEKAKEVIIEAISINPQMPTAYYNLGKVLYLLGNHEASARAYKASYERDILGFISSKPYQQNNFYVHLGHSLLDFENNNKEKYKNLIDEYKMGMQGKLIKENSKYDHSDYEKLCVEASKKYLNE